MKANEVLKTQLRNAENTIQDMWEEWNMLEDKISKMKSDIKKLKSDLRK